LLKTFYRGEKKMRLSLFTWAVLTLLATSAFATLTTNSPILSPMLGEYNQAHVTDEASRQIPLIAVVTPDASGTTGLSNTYYTAGQYSGVTGRDSLPQYTLSSGQKVGIMGLMSLSGNSLVPLNLGGSVTLSGDVTGLATSNTVATVGGSTAASIHTAASTVAAATNLDTPSTLVERDGSGNFAAGTVSTSAVQITPQAASHTPTCAGGNSGTLAFTSLYVLCVCNGTSWVKTADGSTACTF
jgi:hypothetical protein